MWGFDVKWLGFNFPSACLKLPRCEVIAALKGPADILTGKLANRLK